MNHWKAPSDTALVIVDPQVDFCSGGNLAVPDGEAIMPLLNEMQNHFDTIVITQDWHPADHSSFASQHQSKSPLEIIEVSYGSQTLWPDHCVQNSTGAEFHPDLTLSEPHLVLQKGTNQQIDSYSGFYENDGKTKPTFSDGETLTAKLRSKDITRIVFAGLAYDFCVGWHALDAVKEGFSSVVVQDACRSIAIPIADSETTETQMTQLMGNVGVVITDTQNLAEAISG